MITLRFYVSWHGEIAAGIRAGEETVAITFEHTDTVDSDTIEFWRDSLKDYFDGARVQTLEEAQKEWESRAAGMKEEEEEILYRGDLREDWSKPQ